jgi:hypothetical protein
MIFFCGLFIRKAIYRYIIDGGSFCSSLFLPLLSDKSGDSSPVSIHRDIVFGKML